MPSSLITGDVPGQAYYHPWVRLAAQEGFSDALSASALTVPDSLSGSFALLFSVKACKFLT